MIDSLAGGSLHMKTTEEALELIEIVANNQYMYSSERAVKSGVMELSTIDTLSAQKKIMSQQINSLNQQAKFGAKVAKESVRNDKIAKKSLKVKSRAYVYAPKKPMRTHCHNLGVTS
ncbi:hypothetical protein PIB30_075644 [Stylosanthes scabra]|uniref:Uncharacterized protein n=1 Tax=Stylosanthes scabra TaxID=79078 RepID=A0ABU6XQ02_9FABA|nr:hypothetical protein [Stylosanthes scabra]